MSWRRDVVLSRKQWTVGCTHADRAIIWKNQETPNAQKYRSFSKIEIFKNSKNMESSRCSRTPGRTTLDTLEDLLEGIKDIEKAPPREARAITKKSENT